MSSCESELVSLWTGAQEAMFTKALLAELDLHVRIVIYVDSSSCIAMMHKKGLGRLKHLDLKYLRLQDLVQEGVIEVRHVVSSRNLADVMTKYMAAAQMTQLLQPLGVAQVRDVQTVEQLDLVATQRLVTETAVMMIDAEPEPSPVHSEPEDDGECVIMVVLSLAAVGSVYLATWIAQRLCTCARRTWHWISQPRAWPDVEESPVRGGRTRREAREE